MCLQGIFYLLLTQADKGAVSSPVFQVSLGGVKKCAQSHRGTEPWNKDAKAGRPPSQSLSHVSFLKMSSGQERMPGAARKHEEDTVLHLGEGVSSINNANVLR